MRILVFSDIHDNIEHLRLLREKESNIYDAIIVAGDIGYETVKEFLSILDSFECPSFCVYGNWDSGLIYEKTLSKQCTLLHHEIVKIEDFFVTGFSGSSMNWGKNPIYIRHKSELNEKHSEILLRLEDLRNNVEEQEKAIHSVHQENIESLYKKTKDHRRKDYKRRVDRLEARKGREIEKARKVLEKLYKTNEYKKYQEDRWALSKEVLIQNRKQLFDKIRRTNMPQRKLIIVTHERMYKVAEEEVFPLLHIFGHIHEYKFNVFKGTYYLNPAAIDNGFSGLFGRAELLPEGYCDVTIFNGEVTVERRLLFENVE